MRKLSWMLAVAMLLAMITVSARATVQNAWYVYPELRDYINAREAYQDYVYIEHNYTDRKNQQTVALILSGHSLDAQLIILQRDDEGVLQEYGRYLAAVADSGADQDSTWTVKATESDGFTMHRYWEGELQESYTFAWNDAAVPPRLELQSAQMQYLNFQLDEGQGCYLVEHAESDGSYVWNTGAIPLDNFCLSLMPEQMEDVWVDNLLRASLPSLTSVGVRAPVVLEGDDKMAVYAAPSSKAYRSANGKACVYADESIWLRGGTEDGKWWLVEYDVTDVSGRIGYIKAPLSVTAPIVMERGVTATMAQGWGLTDDPYRSHSAICTLKKGVQVTCLGYVDAFWAYVETKASGKTARGFVPLSTLALPDEGRVREVEEKLVGTWRFAGGAEVMGDGMTFGADGACTILRADEDYEIVYPLEHLIPLNDPGTYAVYTHDPAMPGWWEDMPYLLVYRTAEGFTDCGGLSFDMREDDVETFDLYELDAGGTYEWWKN